MTVIKLLLIVLKLLFVVKCVYIQKHIVCKNNREQSDCLNSGHYLVIKWDYIKKTERAREKESRLFCKI